jgi:uncharacterized membrane protein
MAAGTEAVDRTKSDALPEIMRDEAHAHIVEAAYSIAQLHAEHHRSATAHERTIGRATGILGQPWFIVLLTLLIGGWQAGNFAAGRFGLTAIDPPPFAGLATAVSLGSLSIMLLILATQSRENRLAEKRDQLTLELALLGEKKTAKVIELLEELRRDFPLVQDRVDEQADALAKPADPEHVIKAIVETHAQADAAAASSMGEAPQAGKR